MKKILFGIILLLLTTSVAHSQESAQLLQCTIESDKGIYNLGEDINIILKIKNTSKDKLSFNAIPAFELESNKLSIWGPVKFDNENLYRNAAERSLLKLGAFEEKIFKYNLNKIKWDRSISSVWPNRPLNSLITPDDYSLYFTIEIKDGTSSKRLTSNSIGIKIVWIQVNNS